MNVSSLGVQKFFVVGRTDLGWQTIMDDCMMPMTLLTHIIYNFLLALYYLLLLIAHSL